MTAYTFQCYLYKDKKNWLPVYVDEDIYLKYKGYRWEFNRNGYPRSYIPGDRVKKRCVLLHRLAFGLENREKSVHHITSKRDCRRKYLKLYDTWEEHMLEEHLEEEYHQTQFDRREERLCMADLHPHCG